jgi:hypothetical protein
MRPTYEGVEPLAVSTFSGERPLYLADTAIVGHVVTLIKDDMALKVFYCHSVQPEYG